MYIKPIFLILRVIFVQRAFRESLIEVRQLGTLQLLWDLLFFLLKLLSLFGPLLFIDFPVNRFFVFSERVSLFHIKYLLVELLNIIHRSRVSRFVFKVVPSLLLLLQGLLLVIQDI